MCFFDFWTCYFSRRLQNSYLCYRDYFVKTIYRRLSIWFVGSYWWLLLCPSKIYQWGRWLFLWFWFRWTQRLILSHRVLRTTTQLIESTSVFIWFCWLPCCTDLLERTCSVATRMNFESFWIACWSRWWLPNPLATFQLHPSWAGSKTTFAPALLFCSRRSDDFPEGVCTYIWSHSTEH